MKQPAPLLNATQTIITLLLWLLCYVAHGQPPSKDLQQYMPQPFIDKIELVVGPSVQFPNDNGYSEFIYNVSGKADKNVFSHKWCYIAGIGLMHSLNKRFELSGRILWERKGYNEELRFGLPLSNKRITTDARNDYLSVSFAPRLYMGKSHCLYFFAGGFYSWLIKAEKEERYYINGQLNEVSITINSTALAKYEWGLSAGIGYSFHLTGKNSIVMQIQGSHGLSNIESVNQLRITSQSLALSISYQINRRIQIQPLNPK